MYPTRCMYEGCVGADETCHLCTEEAFEIYNLVQGTIIYHGTFFKLLDCQVWTPAFYSTDILQSLGHILTKFDVLNTKNDQGETKAVDKRLNDISNCFPLLYSYKVFQNVKLLKLINPSNFLDTFNILFNKEKLAAAIAATKMALEIIHIFHDKLSGILPILPEKDYLTTESFGQLFDLYIENCKDTCFGGWGNTPGYTLLTLIDYNKYLVDIGLIEGGTSVHGIYVERDQDEIILLKNDDCLVTNNVSFVLPYEFVNKPRIDAQAYIDTYIKYATELKNTEKTVVENYNNRAEFINHVIPYAYIDNNKKWDIDWFFTQCVNYNPYKEIRENCARNLPCKFRKPGDFDRLITSKYIWENEYETNCSDENVWKSSKISLVDMDNMEYFVQYIKIIENIWTEQNLHRLAYCSVPLTKKKTFRQLR